MNLPFQSKEKKEFTAENRLEFFELISGYVDGGIQLLDAISLHAQTLPEDSKIRAICNQIVRDVKNGQTKTPLESFKKFPQFFPPYIIGLMSIAQEAGQLPKILKEITYLLKQDIEIKTKISQATFIPKISVVLLLVIIYGAATFVIPKLGDMLLDAGVDLPLATQVILLIGQSMQAFWWLWIVLAIGAVMGFRYFKENYPERWCLIQLRIPFFKVITRHRLHYTFARIFGLCISSGIQPTTALSYTALAVDNWYLRKVLDRAVKSIKDGVPIDVAIEREDKKKVLSRDIYNKLHAGAQNGGLDRLMMSQANTSKNRLEYAVSKIGDKISMTVLIPSYAVVLVLLMSIIGPTIAMQQKLGAGAGGGM